jgi:sugar-phosphatase
MTFKRLFSDRKIEAAIFDMDGTILTSIAAAEVVWRDWAQRHGLDVEAFLPTIHGARAIDTIARQRLAGIDPAAEADQITEAEMIMVDGIDAIAGASAFLTSLPKTRWAVATSAPRALAARRISVAGLPPPPVIVGADDVARGKPAPDCFLEAARRLNVAPETCVVFEDTAIGVAAAKAAGMAGIVIAATHRSPMATTDPLIDDYRALRWEFADGLLHLSIATD